MLNAVAELNPKLIIEQSKPHHIDSSESYQHFGYAGCSFSTLASGISYLTGKPALEELKNLMVATSTNLNDLGLTDYAEGNQLPDLIVNHPDKKELIGFTPEWFSPPHSNVFLAWLNNVLKSSEKGFVIEILPPSKDKDEFIKRLEDIDSPLQLTLFVKQPNLEYQHSILASPLANSRFRMIHDSRDSVPFPLLLRDLDRICDTFWSFEMGSGKSVKLLWDEPQFVVRKLRN